MPIRQLQGQLGRFLVYIYIYDRNRDQNSKKKERMYQIHHFFHPPAESLHINVLLLLDIILLLLHHHQVSLLLLDILIPLHHQVNLILQPSNIIRAFISIIFSFSIIIYYKSSPLTRSLFCYHNLHLLSSPAATQSSIIFSSSIFIFYHLQLLNLHLLSQSTNKN